MSKLILSIRNPAPRATPPTLEESFAEILTHAPNNQMAVLAVARQVEAMIQRLPIHPKQAESIVQLCHMARDGWAHQMPVLASVAVAQRDRAEALARLRVTDAGKLRPLIEMMVGEYILNGTSSRYRRLQDDVFLHLNAMEESVVAAVPERAVAPASAPVIEAAAVEAAPATEGGQP